MTGPDAHHCNGTQAIFYGRRGDVYYGSLHVDPGAGWFPHYAGYADERGAGDGEGANRNLPLAPGAGDAQWLAALDVLCGEVRQHPINHAILKRLANARAATLRHDEGALADD